MKEIALYLQDIWLTNKESDIYVTLYKLGSKPASTIASVAWYERVWTYKALEKFVDMGIVAETIQQNVKHFRIPSLDLLKSHIERNKASRMKLESDYDIFKTQITQLDTNPLHSPPKIQLYEKISWIRALCQDMHNSIQTQWLITIKLFATNTFESQLQSAQTITPHLQWFFDWLSEKNISLTSYLAQWSLIMEHLSILESQWEALKNLPAGANAINLFVIGKEVFLIIYKDEPIAIRFSSPEFARAMHFLLESKNEKK